MPLDPQETLRIFQEEIEKLGIDWQAFEARFGYSRDLQEAAIQRTATAETFFDWLITLPYLLDSIEKSTSSPDKASKIEKFKSSMKARLLGIDLNTVGETFQHRKHKVLMIESLPTTKSDISQVDQLKEFLGYMRTEHQIPVDNFEFAHREYPPEEDKEFEELLLGHTGSLLHNLSEDDLKLIKRLVQKNSGLAQRIIIIKTIPTPGQLREYEALEKLGVKLVKKPYSLREASLVLLGIV